MESTHTSQMSMSAYCIGKSIILPHIRYVNHSGKDMLFHSEVIRFNGHYQTLGCDRMDVSGLCLGHKISRKEFLEKYCNITETALAKKEKD